MKKKLSAVIISQNEAEMIGECLESVRWADEIIVLDAGSTDATCQIAEQYGAKIYVNSQWPGFGKQRQLAQSYATGDYILMIDADERVTPELKKSIQDAISNPETNKVFSCNRKNYFLGKFLRYGGWHPDRIVRLYEREKYQYNSNLVHETLVHEKDQVIPLSGDLLHLTCRDFFAFQGKQLKYAEGWAVERFQQGKRCSIIGAFAHATRAFFTAWLIKGGFLEGRFGLLLAFTKAQYTFNKYVALWTLKHRQAYKEG